jgi:hypothetical protein
VARVNVGSAPSEHAPLPPADPDGRLARLLDALPTGSGPMRLELPTTTPPFVGVQDDVGLCALAPAPPRTTRLLTLA